MRNRILVLDDDNDVLTILSFLLDDSGYDVKALNDANTIFEDIQTFKPDLILIDVVLKDVDGRAVCKEVKENLRTGFLPTILMSGTHHFIESLQLPCAADDFIDKPFDISNLLNSIQKHLSPRVAY
ncbi:response regulator [Mucilaginibacter sp.]|uniref:response regulator n=1 Tax=Mucilaginibacter sp. TaxID=1882438 RepID=UPI00326410C5